MPPVTYVVESERVRRNLEQVRAEVAGAAGRAGRRPDEVEILAATKYVAAEDLPQLASAGISLVGENRAQDLEAKTRAHGALFTWDFIGALQSRRVPLIVPYVRLIHSVASASAMRALARNSSRSQPGLAILIEVNVAREHGKAGISPEELDELIALSPLPVRGLMTMPPATARPEENRGWFAALRELAHERGLRALSMGSTQDYAVAVEEGATIVRIGSRLYA
jgi:pyridoxal phosphate enzyme (YggS family)